MGDALIILFPGTDAVPEQPPAPEIDIEKIVEQQDVRLDRWQDLGEEIKRRAADSLPADLRFELCEILREVRL
jgi:hypothetical protein